MKRLQLPVPAPAAPPDRKRILLVLIATAIIIYWTRYDKALRLHYETTKECHLDGNYWLGCLASMVSSKLLQACRMLMYGLSEQVQYAGLAFCAVQ